MSAGSTSENAGLRNREPVWSRKRLTVSDDAACFQHCNKWNPAKRIPTRVCQTCGKSKEDHITFATFFNKANWSKINTNKLLDQESVESFWNANDKYIIDEDSKILLYQKSLQLKLKAGILL